MERSRRFCTMKPIDYRNATFAEIQDRIAGDRLRVLEAWRMHGPCTTEDLAVRSGIPILTLRPRTTELGQLGFLVLMAGGKRGGVYRAASADEALSYFHEQQGAAHGRPVQTNLALNLPTPSRYY
jgi:hypothetical protein